MQQDSTISRPLWLMSLSEEEADRIRTLVPQYPVHTFTEHTLPDTVTLENFPLLLFVSQNVWHTLSAQQQDFIAGMEFCQKVYIQEEKESADTLEQVLKKGFASIVHSPVQAGELENIVARAEEIALLCDDMVCMEREISLERELLFHKVTHIDFLKQVLGRPVDSLNPASILTQAHADLQMLFPTLAVQGVFWQPTHADSMVTADIFLAFQENTRAQEQWVDFLIDKARQTADANIQSYQLTLLMDTNDARTNHLPKTDTVAVLPLRAGGKVFGILAILSPAPFRLGQEQRTLLHCAVNHWALALSNALSYREHRLGSLAVDLLSSPNRYIFEELLEKELSRAKRYNQHLSLLMLTAQSVHNTRPILQEEDTEVQQQFNELFMLQFGRQTENTQSPCQFCADTTPSEICQHSARILETTLRTTDTAALYDQDCIAVLLPHTHREDATHFAQRIAELCKQSFTSQDGTQLVFSLAVASTGTDDYRDTEELLYAAKQKLSYAQAKGYSTICSQLTDAPADDKAASVI